MQPETFYVLQYVLFILQRVLIIPYTTHIGNPELFPPRLLQGHLPMTWCRVFHSLACLSAQTWRICGATAKPLEDQHKVILRDVIFTSPFSGTDHVPCHNHQFMFWGQAEQKLHTQPVLAFPLATCSLDRGHNSHKKLAVSDELSLAMRLIRAEMPESLFHLISLQKCQMQVTLAPNMIN